MYIEHVGGLPKTARQPDKAMGRLALDLAYHLTDSLVPRPFTQASSDQLRSIGVGVACHELQPGFARVFPRLVVVTSPTTRQEGLVHHRFHPGYFDDGTTWLYTESVARRISDDIQRFRRAVSSEQSEPDLAYILPAYRDCARHFVNSYRLGMFASVVANRVIENECDLAGIPGENRPQVNFEGLELTAAPDGSVTVQACQPAL